MHFEERTVPDLTQTLVVYMHGGMHGFLGFFFGEEKYSNHFAEDCHFSMIVLFICLSYMGKQIPACTY